ncbi:hypothetical protein GCM10010274_64750 [Streptomyces lavendofoliae]|uniref:Uncharacterized protein n=1 Tax=Streptomyces lavendofoliae TaxID=67314 RepID=A0A918M877_9ACTN|nr:hypothetical protein GCM10010274_64750 [Streptomyces lavendofoliae]
MVPPRFGRAVDGSGGSMTTLGGEMGGRKYGTDSNGSQTLLGPVFTRLGDSADWIGYRGRRRPFPPPARNGSPGRAPLDRLSVKGAVKGSPPWNRRRALVR